MQSVQRNGREVENPILRRLVAFGAMALGFLRSFGNFLAILLVLIGIALSVILDFVVSAILIFLTFPFHLLLRVLGRKGFLTTVRDGRFSYTVNLEGFRRAP